jgi:hypothetical protein
MKDSVLAIKPHILKEKIMQTKTRKPSLPPSVEKYIGHEWGQWAPGDRIPIDTPLAACQRPYKERNVFKYIAEVKGLDRNLFGYATAVKRKSDGQLALINGQHRINLVKIVSPGTLEVPAQVIEVDDADYESYASRLYQGFNGTVSRGLSNEELFKSSVMAQDPYALYVESIIEKCNLSIGEINVAPGNCPVVYASFVKCLKLGENETIRAVELLKQGFNTVADEPLHGLVFLFSRQEYADLADSTVAVGNHFEKWITKAVPMFHGINDLKFKKYRQGAWEKGIAYGLAQSFAKFQRNKGLTAPAVTPIKKIWESGFKDEDSGLLT